MAFADTSFAGEAAFAYAGQQATRAGDLNADGYGDAVVGAAGAQGGAGTAYLLLGGPEPTSGSLADASAGVFGVSDDEGLGRSVAGAGDVDGDGFDDLVVGASEGGGAVLVHGSAAPALVGSDEADVRYTGWSPGDLAGAAVAGAGDVDHDGYADLLLGAPGARGGGLFSGAVLLCAGSRRPLSSVSEAGFFGAEPSAQAGTAVAGAGDVNADGFDDFLVGAPGQGGGVAGPGAVWLVLGGAR